MTRVRSHKTNFTTGEISRLLLGRGDLRAYDNGALTLRNLLIHPTGGITRRPGMAFSAAARGAGRLVAFEFSIDQTYLLAFSEYRIDVHHDDAVVATVDSPWTAAQLGQITWTQSGDTLLVCHPDVAPRKLKRTGETAWSLEEWQFLVEGEAIRHPWYRFAPVGVTLTPSATTGTVTLTASAAVFQAGHAGVRLRVAGRQVTVTDVLSATQVKAVVAETLLGTTAAAVWDEQAFSALRGYPVSAAFHQDRLVIGGSRELPNRLWLSRSADIWNFDLGTGLDDEAIEFGILSDQINAIRAVFSGRHLQVFTSGAEWMVTGEPLTPATIQLNRQTRIGSPTDRSVAPRDVDGATLFVSRNGREIREFLYADTEEAYQATDLALLARHLVVRPIDQDYDQVRRLMLVVMADGGLGALRLFRAEEVTAWTLIDTTGTIHSVAVVGDDVYLLVQRPEGFSTRWNIERLDDALHLDAGLYGESATAAAAWSGLDHLEGQSVAVVADGVLRLNATVSGGTITLDPPAKVVEAGLPFTHVVEPLPPNPLAAGGGRGPAHRLVQVVFQLEDTAALRADVGAGLTDFPLRRLGAGTLGDGPPPRVSGDARLRSLGWARDRTKPLWRIEQDAPLPFTLLSVTMELKVND
ncbi:hypothetical protein N825_17925 [Skermanella stibiiresistens SB22]|uniref:Uncharacterized protein n=1 Tax=Skermanella stibiiresistens SB22 TaxID=1385369 RepID=W9GUB0_9PROT|nr:hypothetical protein [Skermanella stibiiresistens]EWY37490.1 hypothetical protein N825_17925 [Skermanella stibiiresistens SB22]